MASASEERFAHDAGEYLRSKNFKTMCEWMTAEVLFAKPEDPLAHLSALTAAKLKARNGAPFDPTEPDRLLAGVYSLPPDVGSAVGSDPEPAPPSTSVAAVAPASAASFAERVLEASRAISSELDPVKAADSIVKHACQALHCERATLWSLDESRPGTLLAMVTLDEAVRAVQVSVGSGIVGAVAESGTPIRIADAYADSRFNPDVDRDTGFRTGSIMAHPVRDAGGNIVGVLQAMNRLADGSHGEPAPGGFTDADESLCAMLSLHIGVALRNVMVFESAVRARAKTDATLSLVRALHESAPSASSLMFSIHSKTPRIVDAERCSLFLADHQHSELWAIQGEVDVRMPMDRGFIGHVATTKATLNVPDAYADARWSGEAMDKKSGFRTKAVLCMPLLGSGGRLVGVVQCINKVPSSGREAFDRQDEEVLATLLALVAPIIEKSALFRSHSSAAADAEGSEFSGRAMTGDHAASAAASAQPAIAEEEEEEEDEG